MSRVFRKKPRRAGKGRVFFDKSGRTVSVSNAPNIRRIRRIARRRQRR